MSYCFPKTRNAYFISSKVPGSSSHVSRFDGHLHIETTDWDANYTSCTNKIFVLRIPKDEGYYMEVVGESAHLGRTDKWSTGYVGFDEGTAYVIAGEPSEEFFIIVDLSNHSNPLIVGELKVRVKNHT